MPRIRTVPPDEATGALEEEYRAATRRAGRVFNILSIQSLHPPALRAGVRLYRALMLDPGPLDRPTREMLATVTSRELDCFYWTEAHGEDLREATGDGELARAVIRDYRSAGLDAPARALMDYAVLVTRTPGRVTDATIDGLRTHGWSDEEILTATEIIGFFNYYARLADALGVEPEDFMERDLETWPEEETP